MLITFGLHLYEKCISYLSGKFSKMCSNKKKSLWYQSIPKYPYTLGILDNICFHFKLNAKKGGLVLPPSTFQSGEGYCPQLLAHEVVLVKFELQTHTQHLNSCRSGVLVVFGLRNLQFSVFTVLVICCQPLNICFFVLLYLYIYIIYC